MNDIYDPSNMDNNLYSIQSISMTGNNPAPATRLFSNAGIPDHLYFKAAEGVDPALNTVNTDILVEGDVWKPSNKCLTLQGDFDLFDFENGVTSPRVSSSLTGSTPLLHTAMGRGLQELVFVTEE